MKYPLSEEQIFSCRPMPFYFITTSDPAELTLSKTEEDLQKLKHCGFGGFDEFWQQALWVGSKWLSTVRFPSEAKCYSTVSSAYLKCCMVLFISET